MLELISLQDVLPEEKATAEYLGGKGYGLHWMQSQGVNVPPALIIPTHVCVEYLKNPVVVMKGVEAAIQKIIDYFTGYFGYVPLLSVRSGARVSMPGMMDTILNVGLTPDNLDDWVARLGEGCVKDSLARLEKMYAEVVGFDCPLNTKDQLLGAIEAVFKSWNNDRAKFYRKMHNIPEDWGTAVVVQAMVFGNLNDNSGTGVLFTRNPDTGENLITGEFLQNAQGEDVVAGTRTPLPLAELGTALNQSVADELMAAVTKLEAARKDVQDVEFTIQDGKLFILQTRNAKRSAKAAVKIALDMHSEGLISVEEVFNRVSARELDLAQQPQIDPAFGQKAAFTGIPACSGVVTGKPVFSAKAAIDCAEPCILITQETTPDDIAGMAAAVGVLTMTGGATSHAAVVARGMNKPCVVGLGPHMDNLKHASKVSIDGATGRVWMGEVPVLAAGSNETVAQFLALAVKAAGVIPATETPLPGVDSVLIDLGMAYSLGAAREKVLAVLGKFKGTVYVDCGGAREGAESDFCDLFVPVGAKYLVGMLEGLPAEYHERLALITNEKTSLHAFNRPGTLEELILSKGKVAFDKGAGIKINGAGEAVIKVFEWLEKDGLKALFLGDSAIPAGTGTVVHSPYTAVKLFA